MNNEIRIDDRAEFVELVRELTLAGVAFHAEARRNCYIVTVTGA